MIGGAVFSFCYLFAALDPTGRPSALILIFVGSVGCAIVTGLVVAVLTEAGIAPPGANAAPVGAR